MDSASAPVDESFSPLLSVPTELLEMIAAFADDAFPEVHPLSKLRLTCRQLRDQVNPESAQRYLSEPFVMMSRYSLKALVGICQHPFFGPRVRKVRLHSYADMAPLIARAKATCRDLLEPAELSTVHHPSEQRVEEAVHKFMLVNFHLRSLGKATKLLEIAFSSLSEYSSPLVLSLETFWPDERADRTRSAPIGFSGKATNAFREALNWIDWSNPACGTILQDLLELAGKSGCRVEGIEIHDFSTTSLHGHELHAPFSIHHRLVSDLTTARFKGYIPRNHPEGQVALLNLVNQAEKLTSLSLGNFIVPNLN